MKRKRFLQQNKIVLILLIVFLVLVFLGIAFVFQNDDNSLFTDKSIVTRSISSSKVVPNGQVEVKLYVDVRNEDTYYSLEDYIPEGWTIVNDGGGATGNSNRLAWVVISDARNIVYTYTLKAPDKKGVYNFEGVYGFEGMKGSVATTIGDIVINVA